MNDLNEPVTEPLAVVARPEPSVANMLQAVIERGVTDANVQALERLVALYERTQERDAIKEYARAFKALQAEMPKVHAVRPVPNKDGSIRYKFAPFEDIMKQVAPYLDKHGFTVRFSTRYDEQRLVKICTLQHTGGHSNSNEFAVRIGQGPPGSTDTQADGAAGTYAKRFVLCDALNIVIEKDADARLEGAPITAAQAEELARRVIETESDKAAFLRFAGAQTFATIPAAKYAILDGFLAKKERRGR